MHVPTLLYSACCAALWPLVIQANGVDQGPVSGTLELPFDVQPRSIEEATQGLRRRDGTRTFTIPISHALQANISVGTPPQRVLAILDTTSSDSFVKPFPIRNICRNQTWVPGCANTGMYNPKASSTYSYIGSNFSVLYEGGITAKGDGARDVFNVSGAILNDTVFGIAYNSDFTSYGVLGLGYPSYAQYTVGPSNSTYPTVSEAMVSAGLIRVNAYSLWMNNISAHSGSVLFGGVDSEKYTGQLQTLPITPYKNTYAGFYLAVTGLSVTHGKTSQNVKLEEPQSIQLESSSPLSFLPASIVAPIWSFFNVTNSTSGSTTTTTTTTSPSTTDGDISINDIGHCDCTLANQTDTYLNITLSTLTIKIAISELVLPSTNSSAKLCTFGLALSSSSSSSFSSSAIPPTLGTTFLGSAYAVFDLSNHQISLAQARYDSTRTNVSALSNSPYAVPGAIAVTNAVQARPLINLI